MKKKLLAGLLSVAMLIGSLQPVMASDDAQVTVTEEADENDTEDSYEEDGIEAGDEIIDADDTMAAKPEPEPATVDKSSVSYNTIYAKPVKINKITYDLSAEVSYYDVVKYCGRKIKAATDLDAEVKSPSLESLVALSNLYNCSTDYLLGKEEASSKTIDVSNLTPLQAQCLSAFICSLKE